MMIDQTGRSRARAILGVTVVMLGACSSGGDPVSPGQTVTPAGANFACAVSEVADMAVGEVRTSLPGNTFCVQTSAAAEYMLHAFFASNVASAQTSVAMTGFGITSASTSGAALGSLAANGEMTTLDGQTPRQSLELAFRNYERNVLAPRMSAARLAMRNRAQFSTVVPAVGDVIQLNASSSSCDAPVMRDARVAAVTSRAIVVTDVTNPAGGFTDVEYQSVGVTFDTLVDPVDRAAFGDPTDIDANGHVILFYTRSVNALTPAGSQGVIEGFFNPRDLFPRTASGGLQACPGSNYAEIFYLIAPDPSGTINNNVRTKNEVFQSTVSVVAHEYQHLINAGRRLYVNDADDFEEVWLNEGLSHIAEELVFYRAAGLSPRTNLDAATVTATTKRVDAFNQHQISNFGRYELFLEKPESNSPYADNDSLANRGAVWSFLRYAADRKATSDGTVWQQLVNSRKAGMENLTAVFGADVMSWIRDWSISVYTDDRAATSSTFQQPSWNFRSLYPRIGFSSFPLHVVSLTNSVQRTQTLRSGSSMYSVFGVPGGGLAGLSWTVSSNSVQVSIVRTK